MTLDKAINIFKKFDKDLPEEFRISRQDILNGDVRKINKAYRILAMRYHPDRNSSLEAEEKFKEIGSVYEFLGEEAKYYKTKKMNGAEEIIREEPIRKTDEDKIIREAERITNKTRREREAEEARRKAEEERIKREAEEARRKTEEERIRQEAETKEKEWKKIYEDQDDFEKKIMDLEKQREQGPIQKIINMLTGKSTQGGIKSKRELQKIVKRIRKKKIPKIKDEKQHFEYQTLLFSIEKNKRYGIATGQTFNENNSIECFNKLMGLETSIDNVLMAQELGEIEKSPMIRPDYTGTSRPKDEGPVITPEPKKPPQLGPGPRPGGYWELGGGLRGKELEKALKERYSKKGKTVNIEVPKNLWIPLLQFIFFLLGIYLLLLTPYWIFGLPLVIAGVLLLFGIQSEREGLRELFHWFLTDKTGHVWGMILVVGIGTLIIGFSLGDWWIASIPLVVMGTYHIAGRDVVGKGHFIEYTIGLSGVTIILYYFFRSMPYIATIPVIIVFVFRIFGDKLKKHGVESEHLTELIMTIAGIILFIGGIQYAASYLDITFSWVQLAGFGLFNTVVLIVLWSMEEGGVTEKDKAETEEAKAAAEYYKRMIEEQNRPDEKLEEWKKGAEKEKRKQELEQWGITQKNEMKNLAEGEKQELKQVTQGEKQELRQLTQREERDLKRIATHEKQSEIDTAERLMLSAGKTREVVKCYHCGHIQSAKEGRIRENYYICSKCGKRFDAQPYSEKY